MQTIYHHTVQCWYIPSLLTTFIYVSQPQSQSSVSPPSFYFCISISFIASAYPFHQSYKSYTAYVVYEQYFSIPAPFFYILLFPSKVFGRLFFLFLAPILLCFIWFFSYMYLPCPHCTVLPCLYPAVSSLLCSTCLLSFVQGLNSTLGDKDPPLDTDKRSHYTEGRQSQLRLALFLSYMYTH